MLTIESTKCRDGDHHEMGERNGQHLIAILSFYANLVHSQYALSV